MREIIRASAWGGFAELVTSLGGDVSGIFAAAHLDPRLLEDPERYLPLQQFVECHAIAAERLKRKDFGLLIGQKQSLSTLGPMSIAMINSRTAREGITTAARFMHVHNPALSMSLTPIPRTRLDLISCKLQLSKPARREQNDERVISIVHSVMKQLAKEQYQPHAIWFTHARISPMSVYRRVFGLAPLFEQPTMGIALERSVLDSTRTGASEKMREIAESYLAEHALTHATEYTKSVAAMARSLMRGGEFTPAQTAKALGMHPRTLQRRLREEGSSFEKIKDIARREWAEALLAQTSVSLTHIAAMLGYADASAFSRSCRRWFGEAPRDFRVRLKAKKPPPRTSRVNSLEANLRARWRAGV